MSRSVRDFTPRCITCRDEAIEMRVLEASDEAALCVDEHGTQHEVAVELIGAVRADQLVLVHAGVAIA